MKDARGRPAIVVGAGVEALVAACMLARSGWSTVVLERRDEPGGRHARWPEVPGSRAGLLFDEPWGVHPTVYRELQLARHGLERRQEPTTLGGLTDDGRVLELSGTTDATRKAIAAFSARDARAYGDFVETVQRLSLAVAPLVHRAIPAQRPQRHDLWTALVAGRRVLGLPRREVFALLRWPPMAVADLAADWFESEPLRALVATRGLFGVFGGPRSAGTSAVLLLRAVAEGGLVPRTGRVRGGPPALVEALIRCARAGGVEIRTGAEVARVLVERERAIGVQLSDGTRMDAPLVVSGLDPRRTLFDLLDPEVLAPDLAQRARHVRARGSIARLQLVVEDPAGIGVGGHPGRALPSALHIATSLDALERAFDASKYGAWADSPWLEVSMHPAGEPATGPVQRGVLSVTAHCMPTVLRVGTWASARDAFAEHVVGMLAACLPGLTARLVERHVMTPEDIERQLGVSGGHPLHAELALDQLGPARPALGLGGHRPPVSGLYLCGPGTHPGLGPLGTSGLLASRAIRGDLRRQPAWR